MEKSLIKQIILEHHQRIPSLEIKQRRYSIDPKANYIFTGQRRAGKTWLMYSLIHQHLDKGGLMSAVLYINFEDERLIGFTTEDFALLMDAWFELFVSKPILFFDEIQNIQAWQKFARRMADTGFQVYITGSNAEMLSNEMSSTLGGRFFIKEIETLDFQEYLVFHDIKLTPETAYSPDRFRLIQLFDQYFSEGGFPELINYYEKKEYLSNLFQKVFLGDIISRYGIRNPFSMKVLVKKLAESSMDEVSFNRIRNIIASTGIQIGTATVIEYIKILEEAFLIASLPNGLAKVSSRESKKKYYFRDIGLLGLFLVQPESNKLETLIFNYLRRKYVPNIQYLRNGYEVDFYVPEEALIQVCYSFADPITRKRELSALMKARQIFQVNTLQIITYSQEETLQMDGMQVQVIPAWKFISELHLPLSGLKVK